MNVMDETQAEWELLVKAVDALEAKIHALNPNLHIDTNKFVHRIGSRALHGMIVIGEETRSQITIVIRRANGRTIWMPIMQFIGSTYFSEDFNQSVNSPKGEMFMVPEWAFWEVWVEYGHQA